jgi:Ni/Co efflux regulator RcnB
MKKLFVIASLIAPFAAAQAQQAPTAPAPQQIKSAKDQQDRHAKDAACQKQAKDQGLGGNEFKQAVVACMKK